MYDGTPINGPADLRQALMKHSDAILLSFTESLMTYALGRPIEFYDMPAVRTHRPRRGEERQSHVGVHLGCREQRGVSDGQGAAVGDDGSATVETGRRARTAPGRLTWRHRRWYITQKHLSRRTVLRGMGATVALPFLEAMVPARDRRSPRPRPASSPRGHRDGARLGRRDGHRAAEEPVVAGGRRAATSTCRRPA